MTRGFFYLKQASRHVQGHSLYRMIGKWNFSRRNSPKFPTTTREKNIGVTIAGDSCRATLPTLVMPTSLASYEHAERKPLTVDPHNP